MVVLTKGRRGSIVAQQDEIYEIKAGLATAIDTTGAGDCFNAGIVFGLLRNWDILKMLRFANALAAIMISRRGGDRYPTLGEVEEYLHKWR